MTVKLIRKSDGEVITKEGVKEVRQNVFGNPQLVFENGKTLTLQKCFFDVITEGGAANA